METVEATFARSVRDHDAELVRTTAADAPATIDDLLDPPVVGVALDSVGVSLSDLEVAVETDPTPEAFAAAATGLTPAVAAIAEYGTVVIGGTPAGEEPASLYPERHVAVVAASDVVPDMADAIDVIAGRIGAGHRSHVLATGPSATADMGELVLGAHGPKAVTVVVVTDR